MDIKHDVLAAEIDRILSSPYPTQLKTLHNVVLSTSETDICLWAKCYACRVTPLGQVLIDALPHWPYVSDIITRMACAVSLRDALLQAEPSLLQQVISKAIKSGNRKYLYLAVALLSHPLPKEIALPTETQIMLIQLFEIAAAEPDVSSLKPIHRLIHGACRELIGVLPFKLLSTLEDRLMTIMRTLAPVKNKTSAIYCLSIMKAILDSFSSASQLTPIDVWNDMNSSNGSQDNMADGWRPDTLARLFRNSRAFKTLSLITLQVIWACTSGYEKSEPEASIWSVVMANDIVGVIPPHDREEWCRQNIPVIRKLQDRCLVQDLSPSLRFQALTFLVSIVEKVSVPQQCVFAYEQLMLDFGDNLSSTEQLDLALQTSLSRFAPLFSSQWWEAFVSNCLVMLVERKATTVLCTEASLACLLDRLSDAVEEYPECREGLVSAFAGHKYRQKVDQFLNDSFIDARPSGDSGCCIEVLVASTDTLASSFCSLLLRGALAIRPNETQLPSNLIPGILKRHASTRSASTCPFGHSKPKSSRQGVLFVEVESTPDMQQAHTPWKEKLATKMQDQAQDHQRAVLASFAEICRDLEERCENVELPLRQEQEKFAHLQSRHEQLMKASSELEAQVMDRDLRINVLEAENDSNVAQLETRSAESEDLMHRVEEANKELQQANEHALEALATAKQETQKLELEHATTMACKQEALDDIREELRSTHEELQKLLSELGRLKEGGKQNDVQRERLHMDFHELSRRLRDNEDKLSHAEAERVSLSEKRHILQQELEKLREDISHADQQNEHLKAELDDVRAESKQNMDRATSSFEETMSKMRQEWLRTKSDLEKQFEDSRSELAQAEDDFRREHEANKQKTSELRKRIDLLNRECHRKDAQVAEAQEMRNQLINVMGLAGAMPAAMPATIQEPSTKSSTLPYRSVSTMATPKPSSQHFLSTPAHVDNDDDEEQPNDSYDSDVLSNHGPIRKRAKPRQSLGRTGTQQPPRSTGRRSVKSALRTRSAGTRQPLLDLDINRSPAKGTKSPSKVAFKDIGQDGLGISTAERIDLEEWSFSGADIVTGTPGIGLNDEMDCLDEESTADVP